MGREVDPRLAFEELFAAHYWAVRAYVIRRARSESAEDVIAETFLIAWRRLDSLGEDPLPWLFGVARRVMANQQRADRRRSALAARLQGLFAGETSHWEAPTAMSDELAVAMIGLSAQEREALLLVAWEGLEPARAARAAGCSAGAFRARLHRARRHVAASLADSSVAPHSSIAGESS